MRVRGPNFREETLLILDFNSQPARNLLIGNWSRACVSPTQQTRNMELISVMADTTLNVLFQKVADDVASLPVAAVQLVGAVVAIQHHLPPALRDFIMARLSLRADMRVVSPAAEAVMRICAFSAYSDTAVAKREIQTQGAFLKAIAMDTKVLVAAQFISRLGERLTDPAVRLTDAKSLYCRRNKNESGSAFGESRRSAVRQ